MQTNLMLMDGSEMIVKFGNKKYFIGITGL